MLDKLPVIFHIYNTPFFLSLSKKYAYQLYAVVLFKLSIPNNLKNSFLIKSFDYIFLKFIGFLIACP